MLLVLSIGAGVSVSFLIWLMALTIIPDDDTRYSPPAGILCLGLGTLVFSLVMRGCDEKEDALDTRKVALCERASELLLVREDTLEGLISRWGEAPPGPVELHVVLKGQVAYQPKGEVWRLRERTRSCSSFHK